MNILLVAIIILLILNKFLSNTNDKQNQINSNESLTSDEKYLESFSHKEYLLTVNELKFYKLLKQITNDLELNLFCQVAMYELVNCNNFKAFNRIKSKSIDFVITEKNCKIKLCIELDDNSHNKSKRKERDLLIEKIFNKADLKLLRIPVQNFYNLDELSNLIKNNL